MAWLHACDLPLRSVISGWHRYCADYIVPACIQWDGPRQLTVRRRGERKGKGVGAENKQRNCEQQRCRSLLYRLPRLTRKRTSFLGTMNCSRRCHCPIARGSCHVSHSKLFSYGPPRRHPFKSLPDVQCLNFPFIDWQHRADRTTGTLSIYKFSGIYIWFHCRYVWYRGLLMYGEDIEKSTWVFVMGVWEIFTWY